MFVEQLKKEEILNISQCLLETSMLNTNTSIYSVPLCNAMEYLVLNDYVFETFKEKFPTVVDMVDGFIIMDMLNKHE